MMSLSNSISSLGCGGRGHHQTAWPAVASACQVASTSRRLSPSSLPILRRRNKKKNHQLFHSLPTWTHLRGGGHDAGSNGVHQSQHSEQYDSQKFLEATYSTPKAASEAYNCGLLKSDYNISSNALRIRLAFRYLSQLQDGDEEQGNAMQCGEEYDDDVLYLCWIRQDGIPCHFRKIIPVKHYQSNNSTSMPIVQADEAEQNGESGALYVNEHDTIENTFPGHAFVFCRRIKSDQSRTDNDDEVNTTKVVQDDNGHIIFLRKEKGQSNGDVESDKSISTSSTSENESLEGGNTNSLDGSDGNKRDEDWEAYYLVVGGFRPGPMPSRSSHDVDDEVLDSNKSVRGSDESSNDGDDTDDESDDDMELQVQLVTIRRSKKMSTPATVTISGAVRSESSIVDDLQVSVHLANIDPTPVDMSSKHYEHVTIGGWPCRIEPGCFPEDDKASLRSRFEKDIAAACQSLPLAAREKLQQSTPIWINKSHKWGPKAAPIRGRDACFHPGAGWLRRNGDNPLKCGSVEFYDASHYLSDCDHWGPGGLILHELCHAWHNIHITNGYDNDEIEQCYELAMRDGLYDCVRVHGPQGPKCKAYACTNPMEYFAELSVAFLGGLDDALEHNKWFPFNRSQLKEHDPRAFDMLCQMWGVGVGDEEDAG